jgi:type I restriction enzyme S subunit
MHTQTPKLRFPEFSDEWVEKKLGKITSLITKGTTPSKFVENGVKFVKIECLEGDYINNDKCLFIDETTHLKELKRSILNKNDILFAIAGATIGKCCIVTDEVLPANTNQALSIVRLKEKENIQFTFQVLTSSKMKRYILDNISVGAQPNLNLEQMGNFTFCVPNSTEQTKIANFLTAIDEKIQALKQKKTLLEQYKKGIMQQIFSQELRFKNDNGSDFDDWEEKSLGEICKRILSKNKEVNTNVLTISAQFGLISQLEFFNKSVSAKDVSGYYLLHEDDFAYNKSYSNGYPMGAIKRLKKYNKGVVSTLYICFRFEENIDLGFVEQYFESGIHNQEIEKVAQEGARNHGLLNIGISDFFNTFINLPSLPEQQKIANFLTAIDEKIEKVSQQITATETYKKGLLQAMFC